VIYLEPARSDARRFLILRGERAPILS